MTVNADVLVEQPVSGEEADRIAGEFADIGLTADVRVVAPGALSTPSRLPSWPRCRCSRSSAS